MSKLITLDLLLKSLNKIAPLYLAQNWDNTGLLILTKVDKINSVLLTNDLTERVLEEAIEAKVNFIISYHPPIFTPLKSINYLNSWKEKIVAKCIENSIAVYSPHTSLDSIDGGICDWIVSPFEFSSKSPIERQYSEDGKILLEHVGIGREIVLREPQSIQSIIDKCKKHFNLKHLRLALATGHEKDFKVSSIACCAGSGFSVLKNSKADLFITGELSHHECLDFIHKGITVILTEHSNCERGYLPLFANQIQNEIGDHQLNIFISKLDQDPLTIV